MTRDDVVIEARNWIGTPYAHQAHAKGIGCDCAGLIGGVALSIGMLKSDWWETDFAPYSGYARQPLGNGLVSILDKFMFRISKDNVRAGDVIVMRFRRDPQHLGIVVPCSYGMSMVHALSYGPGCVAEHRLDDRWMKRITHAYAFPGVD